jgi:siroheme synthase (precorrin-2 oxidase/ferrochelatase)
MTEPTMDAAKKVAIVGAGAAGLAFAHVLCRDGFDVTVYEQNSEVGGVWNYEPGATAMYESLRTNLPKEIMSYNPESPFKESGDSFVSHREVLAYLVDFSYNHHLRQHIKFRTKVTSVTKRISESGAKSWCVQNRSIVDGEECCDMFDCVVISNGHFSKPYIPSAPSGLLLHYKGSSMHSIRYDGLKNTLVDKRVLVVGTNSSGTDVARELLRQGCQVWVSDRNYRPGHVASAVAASARSEVPSSLLPTQMPAIDHVDENGAVVFADGTAVPDIDVIIWCTGYLYDLSFLHIANHWESPATATASGGLSSGGAADSTPVVAVEEGKRVRPLYQQLFHVEDPTLVFAGLPFRVVPFPLFYFQGGSVWMSCDCVVR